MAERAFTEIQGLAARRLAAHKQSGTLDSEDAKAWYRCHEIASQNDARETRLDPSLRVKRTKKSKK